MNGLRCKNIKSSTKTLVSHTEHWGRYEVYWTIVVNRPLFLLLQIKAVFSLERTDLMPSSCPIRRNTSIPCIVTNAHHVSFSSKFPYTIVRGIYASNYSSIIQLMLFIETVDSYHVVECYLMLLFCYDIIRTNVNINVQKNKVYK